MAEWTFEVNEIAIPEPGYHDQRIKVRFKIFRDGIWLKESNSEVAIDPKDLEGLDEKKQGDLIKARVRAYLKEKTDKHDALSGLKKLAGIKLTLDDKGLDPEPKKETPDPLNP